MVEQIIVFDLEATCFRLHKPPPQEIIEIGAVKINRDGEEISRFHCHVKPVIAPKLSRFCRKLTGISQVQVERADEFIYVIDEFEDWINETSKEAVLTSWGRYDFNQLHLESKRNDHILQRNYKHFPLNEQHAKIAGTNQPIGLANALKLCNLEFEGDPHGALDDAINAARIFQEFKEHWKIKEPHFTPML